MTPVETTYLADYSKLLRYATRLTRSKEAAEDIMQNLFLNLKETNTKLDSIKEPLAYCRRSVFGIYFNYVRTEKRRNERDYAQQEILLAERQEYLDTLPTLALRLDLIAEFSNLLLPRQKAVFLLLLEGKSIREIAASQGNTYNTIKHNRRMIVEKLHAFLAERGEEFNYDRIKVPSAV
jgi:RNA polymerase sigma factor (sigma-70 family)